MAVLLFAAQRQTRLLMTVLANVALEVDWLRIRMRPSGVGFSYSDHSYKT